MTQSSQSPTSYLTVCSHRTSRGNEAQHVAQCHVTSHDIICFASRIRVHVRYRLAANGQLASIIWCTMSDCVIRRGCHSGLTRAPEKGRALRVSDCTATSVKCKGYGWEPMRAATEVNGTFRQTISAVHARIRARKSARHFTRHQVVSHDVIAHAWSTR